MRFGPFGSSAAHEFPEGLEWLNVSSPLTLGDLRGKVVLLDFWTYCCINCMHVLPDLKRLEGKYPELVVVGVHSAKFENERDAANVREAVVRYDIEHPVVVDSEMLLWRRYGIRAWPSFVLIDPVGNVAGRGSGEGAFEMFDATIASLSAAFGEQGLLDREPVRFDLERARAPRGPLLYPGKLEADGAGGRLFVSDSNHHRVVVADADGNVLKVIGSGEEGADDGPLDAATFLRPQGMAYDPRDDALYVADTDNHLVRRVDLSEGTVTTVLGTGEQGGRAREGVGTDLPLNSPWDLAIEGDYLYIAMAGPHQLWRMHLPSGRAGVLAGSGREDIVDGHRTAAALAQPSGVAVDRGVVYFADSEVSAARRVVGDRVETLVGAGLFDFGDVDGPLRSARLQHPMGIEASGSAVYVADTYNHKVRVIDLEAGRASTLVGTGTRGREDGPARRARLSEPNDVTLMGDRLYIADTNNHAVRVLDPGTGEVSTLALHGLEAPGVVVPPGPAEVLELHLVALGKGRQVLELSLVAPTGSSWNLEAPNRASAAGEGGVRASAPEGPVDPASIALPLEVTGEGRIRVQVLAHYCRGGDGGLCRAWDGELVVPVAPAGGPARGARVEVAVPGDKL